MQISKFFLFLIAVVWGGVFIQDASAYLDPGTGSFILQLVVAGLLGALLTIKSWWYRMKNFFFKLIGKPSAPIDNEDDPD